MAALWSSGWGRPTVNRVVCASGRFEMQGVAKTIAPADQQTLEQRGSFDFEFKKRGKPVILAVDSHELALFKEIPMPRKCREIPQEVQVLCVHCTADQRVPVSDVAGYVNHIPSAELHLIQGGSHEYKEEGVSDELFQVWKAWMAKDHTAPLHGRPTVVGRPRL